jgi:hypothetical protein
LTNVVVYKIAGIRVIEVSHGFAYTDAGAVPAAIDYTGAYNNTHFSAAILVDVTRFGLGKTETRIGMEEYATGLYVDVMQASSRTVAGSLTEGTIGIVAMVEND